MLDEEGAEGGQGHHGDGDAGFDPLPVDFPDYVNGFGVAVAEARDSDDGYDNHDEGEAKRAAEEEFGARAELNFAEDEDGDHDY